jgi:hypothetical protein
VRACRIGPSLYIIIYIQQRRREPHLYSLCLRSYFLFLHFSLSLSLIPFGCLRLCKYIQTLNHKKEKKQKKNLAVSRDGEPYGNRQSLSFSASWEWLSPLSRPGILVEARFWLLKKKKTNARQQQLSFLISKTTVQYSLFRDLYRVQNDDYSVSLIMPTNLSLSTGNVGWKPERKSSLDDV